MGKCGLYNNYQGYDNIICSTLLQIMFFGAVFFVTETKSLPWDFLTQGQKLSLKQVNIDTGEEIEL